MVTEFIGSLTTGWVITIYVIATIVIAVTGSRLSKEADRLADLTGLGEALIGAVLLGGVTSLSGIVTSVTAAYENHPQLAVSNAIGGIALQTVFLAVADATYPKANLEHAAASLSNIMQAILLLILLSFIWLSSFLPEVLILGFHPASVILIVTYLLGQRMISRAGETPMWNPVQTKETKPDIPDEVNIKRYRLRGTLVRFIFYSMIISFSGYMVAKTAVGVSGQTGLSESVIGAFFTALSTSLPELIVSLAAVRQGALTLAVANIIGGNTFDMLFVAFSDFTYTKGSIFHTFNQDQYLILCITSLLNGILVLGLLHRQRKGIAKIGWESILIILLFLVGYGLLFRIS